MIIRNDSIPLIFFTNFKSFTSARLNLKVEILASLPIPLVILILSAYAHSMGQGRSILHLKIKVCYLINLFLEASKAINLVGGFQEVISK